MVGTLSRPTQADPNLDHGSLEGSAHLATVSAGDGEFPSIYTLHTRPGMASPGVPTGCADPSWPNAQREEAAAASALPDRGLKIPPCTPASAGNRKRGIKIDLKKDTLMLACASFKIDYQILTQ